jgi:hypothetical protein
VVGIGVLPLIGLVARLAIRVTMSSTLGEGQEITDEMMNAWANEKTVTA